MTSSETTFVTFMMRGFVIGLAACLAVWGAHCIAEPPAPPPTFSEDAGPLRADATVDTARPLPEPEEGAFEYADACGVDCAAYPWCGLDFCDPDVDVPPICWPPVDVPWMPFGRPAPGAGHLQQ